MNNDRIIDVAVSDSEGIVEFFYAGSFNEGATTTVKGRFQSTAIPVSCKPLSELLTDDEIAAARLIKIDVEGAELRVINGLVSILPLLPEDCEVIVEISGDSVEGSGLIYAAFAGHGFHAYELENDYDPLSYLYPQAPSKPLRLSTIPKSKPT